MHASLDIVQAVELILSNSLQLNAHCFDRVAADKYEFKCSHIQLEEWAFVASRTMLWFFRTNENTL